jgi:hypothetical protein
MDSRILEFPCHKNDSRVQLFLIVITEEVFISAGGSLITTNFEYLEKVKSKNQKFQIFREKYQNQGIIDSKYFKNLKKPSSFMKDSLISKQLFDFFKNK